MLDFDSLNLEQNYDFIKVCESWCVHIVRMLYGGCCMGVMEGKGCSLILKTHGAARGAIHAMLSMLCHPCRANHVCTLCTCCDCDSCNILKKELQHATVLL